MTNIAARVLAGLEEGPPLGAYDEPPDDELFNGQGPEPESTTWQIVDLEKLRANGLHDEPAPVTFTRTDGLALVYAGKVNGFQGESESAKTFGACVACAEELRVGRRVLFLDFEDDANTVVSRMLALGSTWDDLIDRFHYIRPEEPLVDRQGRATQSAMDFLFALQRRPDLAVIDGVTEAMTIHGYNPLDNADSADFGRILPKRIAKTGCAVITIDHVTKSKEERGKYALGAQHKRAAVTGAQYTFIAVQPFGRGQTGVISITVEKDKPGHVRRALPPGKKKVAELRLVSNDDGSYIAAELRPPSTDAEEPFRPTALMERVSRWLQGEADERSGTKIREEVQGKSEYLAIATKTLADEGYLTARSEGRSTYYRHARPYREADDQDEQP